ncbi:hypothetical protein PTKIN_Ptkin11bG0043300 [Pterospermum kingtungense]
MVQAWNGGLDRNQKVPEEHRVVDQEASISEAGEGNSSGFQDRSKVLKQRCGNPSRSSGGVSNWKTHPSLVLELVKV